MTDAPPNHKIKALELANQHSADPAAVVARAAAYHSFLSGTAAAPASGAKSATPPATGGKPGGAPAGGKPATTPAGGKPAAGAKPGAPAGGKPATTPAGAKPATKPAGAAATKPGAQAGFPSDDTKDPKGTATFKDVCDKLKEIMSANGNDRAKAFGVLKEHGGGVASVRDLKPAMYDKVVAACDAELGGGDPPEQVAGGGDADGTEAPETDELGLPTG